MEIKLFSASSHTKPGTDPTDSLITDNCDKNIAEKATIIVRVKGISSVLFVLTVYLMGGWMLRLRHEGKGDTRKKLIRILTATKQSRVIYSGEGLPK
ncbi:hypothetical protein ElyMa_000728000 [Elysia marginata]|uniref:Transmembrane protein n=1 Tax=Elysia marginata TaxID=1093978 RepID=A0AAV4GMG3_9GAST|nr:hypothetical protein ElyMa_000728000 [Elysia marginata]